MTFSLFFLYKFLFTNIIFAFILCSCLRRLNKDQEHSTVELFLVSLGLAPALVTLLLYYAFLCCPPLPSVGYFLIITVVYVSLFWLGRKEFPVIYVDFKYWLIREWHKLKRHEYNGSPAPGIWTRRAKEITRWFYVSLVLLVLIYLALSFRSVLHMPVDGYDALSYAAEGKALFKIKHIEFRSMLLDPETGIYLPSLHAPSFSLILTWEKILNSLVGLKSDLFFRSIAFYFGLLILAGQYYCLRIKGKWLALLGTIGLLSCFSFYCALIYIHIDTYRIFFIAVVWFYLAGALKKRDRLSYLLLGITSGMAAFAHTLGALMAAIAILVFFVFLKGSLFHKLKIASLVFFLALATGGIHYVIDTLWGSGWIFNFHL